MSLLNYFMFLIGIFALIILGLFKNQSKDLIQIIIEEISYYIISVCYFSLIFLLNGSYNPNRIIMLTSIFFLVILLIYISKNKEKLRSKEIKIKVFPISLFLVIFLLIMLPSYLTKYEYIEMTGDAGVYSVIAMHIAEEGTLVGYLDIPKKLNNELQKTFYKDNYLWFDQHTNKGSFMPGTYLKSANEYYYQFYPVWPILMATCGAIFGIKNQHQVLTLLFIISNFLLLYFLSNLGVNKKYALLGTILLGTSPVTIHFAKYPTSEMLLLFLVLFSIYLISENEKTKYLLSGLVISLFCLSHISSFMYLPLLFLFFPYLFIINKSTNLSLFLSVAFSGFLVSIPYGYFVSYQYFVDIYNSSFSRFFGVDSFKYGVMSVTLAGLFGLFLSVYNIWYSKTKRVV